MWSFQDQQNEFSSLAQTDNPSHLTLGAKNINMGTKKVEKLLGMPPMQEERTYSTITTGNAYPLPERFITMDQLYVLASGQRRYADREYSEDAWRGYMQRPNTTISDYLTNVFVRPGLHKFEVFPLFATAGLTMTMIYDSFTKDMTANDYATGHITTLANGGTVVTFSGETLTPLMAKRWLKTDDGNWYFIDSVNVAAHQVTLLMPYQGTAISGGTSSFVIAEISRLPEGTHDIPVFYALWLHFLGVNRDVTQATYWKQQWTESTAWAKEEFAARYSSAVIPSQRRKRMRSARNPNDYPDLSSLNS